MHEDLLRLELPQQLLEQREGQAELIGNLPAADIAAGQQQLENQGLDFAARQVGGGESLGFGRDKAVGQLLRFAGRRSDCSGGQTLDSVE